MRLILLLITSFSVNAKDLVGSVNSLSQNAVNLGIVIATVGMIVAGIYLALGKHEGKEKIGLAIFGAIVIILSGSMVEFLRRIV